MQLPVPCKMCWQCEENYINDWTGRCLCEAQYATKTCALTLTYRDQVDNSHKILHVQHFQNFMKRLRNDGYKVRYLVAGEYGSLRGRAHFHVLLFFYGNAPDIPNKTNAHIKHWDKGHVYADWSADYRAVRYVAKYALKNFRYDDQDNPDPDRQAWFSMSKKPLIGAQFFIDRAKEYVRHNVLPSSFEYVVDGGKPGKTYLIRNAARALFVKTLVDEYRKQGREVNLKTVNEWTKKAVEKHYKVEQQENWDALPDVDKNLRIDQDFEVTFFRRQRQDEIGRLSILKLTKQMESTAYVHELPQTRQARQAPRKSRSLKDVYRQGDGHKKPQGRNAYAVKTLNASNGPPN